MPALFRGENLRRESVSLLHARVVNRLLKESHAHVVGVLGEGKTESFGGGVGAASGEGRLGAAYDGTAHTARVIKIISVYLARRDIPDSRYRYSKPSCGPSSPLSPSAPCRTRDTHRRQEESLRLLFSTYPLIVAIAKSDSRSNLVSEKSGTKGRHTFV